MIKFLGQADCFNVNLSIYISNIHSGIKSLVADQQKYSTYFFLSYYDNINIAFLNVWEHLMLYISHFFAHT